MTQDRPSGHADVEDSQIEGAHADEPQPEPARPASMSIGARIGAVVVSFWVLVAIFGPWLAPYDVYDDPAVNDLSGISGEFWLGTDAQYRDVFSLILHGARMTIGLSLASTLLAYVIGVILGFAAAIGGGWIDMTLSRLNDAFLSLPTIMTGLVVIAALGSSLPVLVGATGVIYATGIFRVARALALDIQAMDFVEVARNRGEGLWWIITREIWPNTWMPLLTDFGLRLVFAILFISALSFLGLGVQPPQVDWGSMVRENLIGLQRAAPALWTPAVAIATLTISVNLVVDDLSARRGRELMASMT